MKKDYKIGDVIYRECIGDYCEIIAEHFDDYECRVFEIDENGNECHEFIAILTANDLSK